MVQGVKYVTFSPPRGGGGGLQPPPPKQPPLLEDRLLGPCFGGSPPSFGWFPPPPSPWFPVSLVPWFCPLSRLVVVVVVCLARRWPRLPGPPAWPAAGLACLAWPASCTCCPYSNFAPFSATHGSVRTLSVVWASLQLLFRSILVLYRSLQSNMYPLVHSCALTPLSILRPWYICSGAFAPALPVFRLLLDTFLSRPARPSVVYVSVACWALSCDAVRIHRISAYPRLVCILRKSLYSVGNCFCVYAGVLLTYPYTIYFTDSHFENSCSLRINTAPCPWARYTFLRNAFLLASGARHCQCSLRGNTCFYIRAITL